MIDYLVKVLEFVKYTQDVWFSLLEPLSKVVVLIPLFLIISGLSLFFIFRQEYKHFREIGVFCGAELLMAGLAGLVITGGIFLLPAILWATLFTTIGMGIIAAIGALAMASVNKNIYKRGRKPLKKEEDYNE